ncbi:amidohydrolase family protein [Archangium violaceum]|uniref:amidohydrolase family protein n=1 Tax=Archangium violaceum TaxID=83451 RepID=UPI00194E8309|nr:amidohydrolase family protein [Archangium violaceum]QRN99063.1 amidohydrolase family protein [Archangium violaceum]
MLLLSWGSAWAQVTAIRAGRLVDPEVGTALDNQVILVEGSRIKAVGPGLAIPEGATVIDLTGATVLPGLFDAHTHLCATLDPSQDGGEFLLMSLRSRAGYRALRGAAHAREMLEAGFTTVRDLGNAGDYADIDLRRAIKEGLVSGPTMLAAGRIIAPFGGQFGVRTRREVLEDPEYRFADTRDELLKAIRENIFFGADVIKVVVDGQRYAYSTDDLRFIIAEAGKSGLKVAAHAQTKEGAHRAIEAGVASIEHGFKATDEDLALAKKNGVVLVSTDFPEDVLRAFGWDAAGARRVHGNQVERLKRAWKAGLPIVFGTDVMVEVQGQTRGSLALSYIDSFVEAGIPPRAILQSMTVHAARLLGVEKERGAIKPGLLADLVATPRNPLDDIQALKQIHFVMKEGRVVRRSP